MQGVRRHLASQLLFCASVALSLVEQTWLPVGCILTQVLDPAVMVVVCHPDLPLLFLVEVCIFLPDLAKLAMCQFLPDLPLGVLVPLLVPTVSVV